MNFQGKVINDQLLYNNAQGKNDAFYYSNINLDDMEIIIKEQQECTNYVNGTVQANTTLATSNLTFTFNLKWRKIGTTDEKPIKILFGLLNCPWGAEDPRINKNFKKEVKKDDVTGKLIYPKCNFGFTMNDQFYMIENESGTKVKLEVTREDVYHKTIFLLSLQEKIYDTFFKTTSLGKRMMSSINFYKGKPDMNYIVNNFYKSLKNGILKKPVITDNVATYPDLESHMTKEEFDRIFTDFKYKYLKFNTLTKLDDELIEEFKNPENKGKKINYRHRIWVPGATEKEQKIYFGSSNLNGKNFISFLDVIIRDLAVTIGKPSGKKYVDKIFEDKFFFNFKNYINENLIFGFKISDSNIKSSLLEYERFGSENLTVTERNSVRTVNSQAASGKLETDGGEDENAILGFGTKTEDPNSDEEKEELKRAVPKKQLSITTTGNSRFNTYNNSTVKN